MSKNQPRAKMSIDHLAAPLARFVRPNTNGSARDVVAAGAQLLLLKSVISHGEWMPRLEELNISLRNAQRFMVCARRFSHLSDAFFEAVGSASKLHELLSLDAEDVNFLSQGGEVFGVTLNVIREMTAPELRETLRSGNYRATAKAEEVDAPNPRALQLVARLQPVQGVEDAEYVNRACNDLDNDQPELSVAEEVLLRHWRQCDRQGRRALSDAACAMAVATLRSQRA